MVFLINKLFCFLVIYKRKKRKKKSNVFLESSREGKRLLERVALPAGVLCLSGV